jgi:hypothetical protein
MTTYTTELKEKLRVDIRYIDDQLDLARGHMARGEKAEAWAVLDGLNTYFDFKKHFPDILVNESESMRFMDLYEALRDIDDIIEIDATDALTGTGPREWRPGYTRDEILRRLRAFLEQIERWRQLDWFEGAGILDSLQVLKEKIEAFIDYFQNPAGGFRWGPVTDVREAKKRLWRSLSEGLPFAEVYEQLVSMDRNLTYLVFRFRLHLDELTPEAVEASIADIVRAKHAILAIIDAARAVDEIPAQPPANENGPRQPPPGWDDLQPYPPAGYAFFGGLVPVHASRRKKLSGEGAGIDAGVTGNSGLVRSLLAFALGAVAALVACLLFGARCPF